jgi:CelD/BcsL family acetyltransferase involved in cellulose biosynthesis
MTTEQNVGISVHTTFESVETVWRSLESGACYGFQLFDWVRAWYETIGRDEKVALSVVVVESARGEPVMLLPLGIARSGMLKRLVWLGGKLSDYPGPLLGTDWQTVASADQFPALWDRILKVLPALDAVVLDRLPDTIDGQPNPLLSLPSQPHPSSTHQALLTGDLKSFVKSKRSNKSVATDRRKERRLAEHGDIRFVVATEPEQQELLLPALYRQKGAGYQALGVTDLFAQENYRTFIAEACRTMPASALLTGLMVGDRVAATCFSLVHGERLYYLLPGYERDELTRFGPGNVLLYRLFEWCFERGVTVFDFTLGDEPYKYFWSEQEMAMQDHFRGLTPVGHLYILALKFSLRLKTRIKRSPRLRDALLAVRRFKVRI